MIIAQLKLHLEKILPEAVIKVAAVWFIPGGSTQLDRNSIEFQSSIIYRSYLRIPMNRLGLHGMVFKTFEHFSNFSKKNQGMWWTHSTTSMFKMQMKPDSKGKAQHLSSVSTRSKKGTHVYFHSPPLKKSRIGDGDSYTLREGKKGYIDGS